MPRPRFAKLPPDQQAALLDAALAEFAENGYEAASLNRVIAKVGVSKGALYYYFDGKEDLYAEVIRRQMTRLLHEGDPLPIIEASDADGFWRQIEELYAKLMERLLADPQTAALVRDWLTGSGAPALRTTQEKAEQAALPWLRRAVQTGRRVGAIRQDLPDDLVISAALRLGQALDTWLMTRPTEVLDIDGSVAMLVGMMRGAFEPREVG